MALDLEATLVVFAVIRPKSDDIEQVWVDLIPTHVSIHADRGLIHGLKGVIPEAVANHHQFLEAEQVSLLEGPFIESPHLERTLDEQFALQLGVQNAPVFVHHHAAQLQVDGFQVFAISAIRVDEADGVCLS